jgi:hypothetical protein
VKNEIQYRLVSKRKFLLQLGSERSTPAQQMAYLIDMASQFQRLVNLALTANHGADDKFKTADMCVAPAIMSRMKTFSDEMHHHGQTYSFTLQDDSDSGATQQNYTGTNTQRLTVRKVDPNETMGGLLHSQESLPLPKKTGIDLWLDKIHQDNRGFELGTSNTTILATAMKDQCSKWNGISLGMVSDVIVIIQKFIDSALASLCKDRTVRDALQSRLSDELVKRYQKAIDSTKLILDIENSDTPMTMNRYFAELLQKRYVHSNYP